MQVSVIPADRVIVIDAYNAEAARIAAAAAAI